MLTVKGKPSAMKEKGRTWKRSLRVENIARLVASCAFTNEQIASAMDITVGALMDMKRSAEFQAKMIELSTGVISQHDKFLREKIENQQEELKAMIPSALLGLRECLLSKNPNVKLAAAKEVMDRTEGLAKVSRLNVVHEDKTDMTRINATAQDIMSILMRPVGHEVHVDSSSFTLTAKQASQQVKIMSESIDEEALAAFDLKESKIN